MDRIDLMKVFCRVVDSASFTRAADTLGMPRSSVSTAIQILEARVGVRLINRTTRRVRATQDGLAFYQRALRTIAEVEETETLFKGPFNKLQGRLHANVPARVGRLIVAPNLAQFLARFPEMVVELGITDRAVNLIEDDVDCVLRVGPLADSGLIMRPVGELSMINVASPAYLQTYGTPHSPADLKNHLAIGYASPTTGRLEDWEWLDGDRLQQHPMRSRVIVNSAEGLIACCVAGLGLIQVPAYDVAAQIAAGELVEVMPRHRAAPMGMNLLYPQQRHLSRKIQVFADWLIEILKREILPR